MVQTFAGQDEWMEELLGDEYYVELFAEIAESEPITEAIDEVHFLAPFFPAYTTMNIPFTSFARGVSDHIVVSPY